MWIRWLRVLQSPLHVPKKAPSPRLEVKGQLNPDHSPLSKSWIFKLHGHLMSSSSASLQNLWPWSFSKNEKFWKVHITQTPSILVRSVDPDTVVGDPGSWMPEVKAQCCQMAAAWFISLCLMKERYFWEWNQRRQYKTIEASSAI